ncbi:bromodomain-containing factor 1-like [Phaseolus vulgaris]|uniref:bromodomain-containing factor 1-like n=1 Tax=Phaseolus vulgaris TaxID=3885 RepID=UPI0035CC0616
MGRLRIAYYNRKLQKTEGQRRSPRLSTLEIESHDHLLRQHLDSDQGPAFRTRVHIRKSFILQDVKHSSHCDIQKTICDDKPSKLASSSFLPETRILQLVLDTLQRKDTYEIFVEPVDPNEVEDYYAIIEEPMDFGTIRAKLHERMYKTLEQFEHDVFLIFGNAMRFNSSGTIYFRQARVINELAKKVFDILRKNPEKFEMEYSEPKRKTGRSNQKDFRNSRNLKSNEINISVPSKTMLCSARSTLNKRSCKTNHLDAKNVVITTGTKECNKCKSLETDRRDTYKPLHFDKDNSTLPIINGQLKLLQHVDQQDNDYKDSLMLFAKDLGPIAQNIAKRKFLGCKILTATTSIPYKTENDTFNIVTTSSMISYHLDHFPSYPNEIRSLGEEIGGREAVKGILNVLNKKGCNPLNGKIWGYHKWPVRCDKEFLSKRFCFEPRYS